MWSQTLLKKINGGAAPAGVDPAETGGSGDGLMELRRQIAEMEARISQAPQSEESSENGDETLRSAFEDARRGLAVIDPYFHLVRANAAFCRLLGYSEKELLALSLKDITHPDQLDADLAAARLLFHGEIPLFRTEKRYLRKDGSSAWADVVVVAVRDRSGRFQYFLNMASDMTEPPGDGNGRPASSAEAPPEPAPDRPDDPALRDDKEMYRLLFESANDAIFLMDVDQFIACNSKTLEMFGCAVKEEIVGRAPTDFSPPEQPGGRPSREQAMEYITAAFEGKPQRFTWKHCRKDGTLFDSEVSLTAFIFDGKPHLLAIVRDLTEKTQAELVQNAVYQISQAADEASSLEELYPAVHRIIGTVMPALNFYISIYDAEADQLSFPYFVDEADAPPAPGRAGKGLTEYVLRSGRSLLCNAAKDLELRHRGEVELVGPPSAVWLGVPLTVEGRTIGAMVVQHYADAAAYGQRELRMLEYVSSQVARSIARKKAEEALSREKRFADSIIGSLPGAFYCIEPAGGSWRYARRNTALEKMLGYPPEEIDRLDPLLTIAEEHRAMAAEKIAEALAGGNASLEANLVTKQGERLPVLLTGSRAEIEGRTYILGMATDIGRRRQAEEALRDSEELYRRLVTAVPDMIIRTDLEGRILVANDVALKLAGVARLEDLLGRDVFSFVAEADRERARQNAVRMFAKRLGPQQYPLVLKDGRETLFEVNGSALINGGGKPYGMVFLCRDITERQRAEEDIRRSLKQWRSTLKAAIDSLASAIEMRDPYTAGHQERVTRLASAIASEMGLAEDRIEGIQIAGTIHDIGKLYVPAEILSKPTRLNAIEYDMIKMHAQVGYTILSKIDFPWPIAQIVHQHHECLDGSGYPLGLAGDDILLEARILCVADVVEAMSSHRPYRPAIGTQAALEEVSRKSGRLYDKTVVETCLRLFEEKKFRFD